MKMARMGIYGAGWWVVLLLVAGVCGGSARGQANELANLNWQHGPTVALLGNHAEINLGADYSFLSGSEAGRLLRMMGNIVHEDPLGFVGPRSKPTDWFIVFQFSDIGYVKDSETIDAGALLTSFKEGDGPQNEERQKAGIPPMHTLGWKVPPHYDPQSNNLEWCLELESEGHRFLNHNIRLLGRRGVMSATLVCDPEQFDAVLAQARQLLGGYSFKSGQKYSEWTTGDKVAAVGLTALVAGGAAAVAVKTGLLGKLIKPIIVGLLVVGGAIAGFFKKIWARLTGRGDE